MEDANPRAVVSLMGPGEPLPDTVTEQDELVDAADDAFVEGIRAAIAVGGGLVLVVLVAGFLVFPKGKKEEVAEEGEEALLGAEEDSSP